MKKLLLLILIAFAPLVKAEDTNAVYWYKDTNVLHLDFNGAGFPVTYWVANTNNVTYRLQRTTNLLSTNWTTVWTVTGSRPKAAMFTYSLGTPTTIKTNPPTFFRLLIN